MRLSGAECSFTPGGALPSIPLRMVPAFTHVRSGLYLKPIHTRIGPLTFSL
jgi:hypothetical protein